LIDRRTGRMLAWGKFTELLQKEKGWCQYQPFCSLWCFGINFL
jgi:hypothetical protein